MKKLIDKLTLKKLRDKIKMKKRAKSSMTTPQEKEKLNNIDIKIGITYPIMQKHQKCVEQVEEYKKGNKTIFASEAYRSGEFDITPRSAWEVKYLKSGLAGDDLHLEHFSDYEMHGYSDGQGLEFFGDGSERLQEAFDNWWSEGRTEESCHRWDWFEENGWGDHTDTKYVIRDGIDIDGYDTSPLWLKNRKKLMGK
jgi:hypothetical protein